MSAIPAVVDSHGRHVPLDRLLARAGEAAVYTVTNDPSRVAKVYHQPPDWAKVEKLEWMCRNASAELSRVTAWPGQLLFFKPRQVIGFLMPKADGFEIHQLATPLTRMTHFAEVGWKFQIHSAQNLAALFDDVQQTGCVIADVNERNYFVNPKAEVRLLDCDSFQITINGQTHFNALAMSQFVPPELIGQPLDRLVRTVNHDAFGLAVLIFKLLFIGRHPYQGVDRRTSGDPTLDDRTREYRFAHGPRAATWEMQPPRYAPTLDMLPPAFTGLFCRAFERGSQNGTRPKPTEWIATLRSLNAETVRCAKEPCHEHWKGVACPWCRLLAEGAPEYYMGAGGHSPAFVVDEARLGQMLARLAQLEAEFDAKPNTFLAGALPTPAPLPLTAEDRQWLSPPGLLPPPPQQPTIVIPPFPEPMPPEPPDLACPPFLTPRPKRPSSIAIVEYPEAEPQRPSLAIPSYPVATPAAPVPQHVTLPRKPTAPRSPGDFDEERAFADNRKRIRQQHGKKTQLIVLAALPFATLVGVGVLTKFYVAIIGAFFLTCLVAWLIEHLTNDPLEAWLQKEREAWEDLLSDYRLAGKRHKQDCEQWSKECQALVAEAQQLDRDHRNRWNQAREDWKLQEHNYRIRKKAEMQSRVQEWKAVFADWQRRKTQWDAAQDSQWRSHPQMSAWRTADTVWQRQADAHAEDHRTRLEQARTRWAEKYHDWQERAERHTRFHQKAADDRLNTWKTDLASWETRRQQHERHRIEHDRVRASLALETRRRLDRERQTRHEYETAVAHYDRQRADARFAVHPPAERAHRHVGGCRALAAQYRNAMQELERASRQDAERNFASLSSLLDAEIPGVGDKRKQYLMDVGIYTAADVTEDRVRQAYEFGDVRTQHVLAWRDQCMKKFLFNPATGVPRTRKAALDAEFRNKHSAAFKDLERQIAEVERVTTTQRPILERAAADCRAAAKKWKQAQTDRDAVIAI